MKVVEMVIDESKDWSGVVEALSLTDTPAIQEDFITLSSEELDIKLTSIDEERRILMGAVLIPDMKILRKNEEGYYQIKFSKETINRASQLFLENGNQGNSTLEHELALTGQTVVESWVIEDEVHDKSRLHGLNHPVGTWMVSMKVDNDEVWESAKAGIVKGFSIEAMFSGKVELSETDVYKEVIKEMKEAILSKLKELDNA